MSKLKQRRALLKNTFLQASINNRHQGKYLPQQEWTRLINEELNNQEEILTDEKEFKRAFNKWNLPNKVSLTQQDDEAHNGIVISKYEFGFNGGQLRILFVAVAKHISKFEKVDGHKLDWWQRKYERYNMTCLERDAADRAAVVNRQTRSRQGNKSSTPVSTPTRADPTPRNSRNSTGDRRRTHIASGTTPYRTEKRPRQDQDGTQDDDEEDAEVAVSSNNRQGRDPSQEESNRPLVSPPTAPRVPPPNAARDLKIDAFLKEAGLEIAELGDDQYDKIHKALIKHGKDFFLEKEEDLVRMADRVTDKEPYNLPQDLPLELKHLEDHGISPRSPTAISNVLKALAVFSDLVPEAKAMELPSYSNRGSGKRILIIQPTASMKIFKQQAKGWLEDFLDTLIGDPTKIDHQEAVQVLIEELGWIDMDALEEVAMNLSKHMTKERKITPQKQMAMKEAANLTWHQFRTIKRHLIQANADILVPEYKMREIRQSFIKPIVKYYDDPETNGKRKLLSWWIPIDQQLAVWLEKLANREGAKPETWGEVHVVFGADHGQGSMKAGIKCLLYDKQKQKLGEEVFQVGDVQCKKDTRAVMLASIAEDLQRSMVAPCTKSFQVRTNMPVTDKEVEDPPTKGPTEDGPTETEQAEMIAELTKATTPKTLVFYQDKSQRVKDESSQNEGESLMHRIPIVPWVVGVLAFQFLVQGRDGGSGHHCARCLASKPDWKDERFVGEPLCHARLCTIADMVKEAATRGDKLDPNEARGVKDKAFLCNHIPIENFLTPVLHAVVFLANRALDGIMEWIQERVEQCPKELVQARIAFLDAALEKEYEEENVDEFKKGVQEATEALEEHKASKPSKMTQEEKAEYQRKLANRKELLKVNRTERKASEKALKKASAAFGKAKAALKAAEKEFPAVNRELRQCIEERLQKECSVYRLQYHGGDMEGNQCNQLCDLEVAERAMNIVKEECLAITDRDAKDDEIEKYTDAFRRLLQLNGMMSSLAHSDYGSLKEDGLKKAALIVLKYNEQYRAIFANIQPKEHMWDHLLQDLLQLLGMGDHTEDFIETMHQEGKRMRRRFGGVSGGILKIIEAGRQADAEKKAAKPMVDAVNKNSKRNFKEPTKAQLAKEQAMKEREAKEAAILEQPTITGLKSLLELQKETRAAKQNQEYYASKGINVDLDDNYADSFSSSDEEEAANTGGEVGNNGEEVGIGEE